MNSSSPAQFSFLSWSDSEPFGIGDGASIHIFPFKSLSFLLHEANGAIQADTIVTVGVEERLEYS